MGVGSGLAIAAGLGAAGSIGGAAIGASAAGNAASDQANAAKYGANLDYQASQNALGFQEQQWNQEQANLQPWLQGGANALGQLEYELGLGNGQGTGYGALGTSSPTGGQGGGYAPVNGPTTDGGPTRDPSLRAMSQGPTGQSNVQRLIGPGSPIPQGGPVHSLNPAAPNTNLGGFGSLMQGYSGGPFVAPTGLTEQNDPGYQARLQLGQQAFEQSAAARGNLLTGGTSQAENQLAQDYASNEYGNVYNRALGSYDTNYNAFQQQQSNQYNRLASLAGLGQTTAQQLGQLGQGASNNVSSNLLNTAANMGQQYNNAAAANASGIIGSANAWGGALGGLTNNLSQLAMLQQLYGQNGGGGGGASSGAGNWGITGDWGTPL